MLTATVVDQFFQDELGINKDRYKSLADEMDSTFAELAGY
ncbi:Tropomyosin-1 [Papilio machaon]|uniref:Tropomyosin-1 n=1 Tax=Papilio machaon TaxID=76193 RepID=A0A194RIP5_PAPMA|nr:Tropomyosin-1 [Papilio machaon]